MPTRLQRISTEDVDLNRQTRNAFEADPGSYRIPRSLGITRNNRLGSQRHLARTAVGAARRELETQEAETREHTARWADRALAEEVTRGAADWTITEHGEIERRSAPAFLEDTTIDEYLTTVRGTAMCELEAFNLRVFDIEPNNLVAFMARNPVTGEIRRDAQGQPFVPWETFHIKLGRVLHAMLGEYGFPPGSFWVIQFLDQGTDAVLASLFNTNEPTIETILGTLDDLEFGISEGSDIIHETYVRLIVGNPGTGAGGSIPPHLKGKRCVWSHKGDGFCAAASLVMCAATVNERKNLNRRPNALEGKIKDLVDSTGRPHPIWGFDDLEAAGIQMGAQILVIDAYAMTLIYETPTEMATKYHLILDQQKQHFMACYSPTGLSTKKAWCGECRKLMGEGLINKHRCGDNSCWACKKGFKSEDELNAHFKTSEWSQCDACWRKMPTECHEKHVSVCKGACKKCPECKETFFDSACSSHQDAISVADHRAACGLGHKWCNICKKLAPKEHRCTITRTDEKYDHEKDKRKLMVFDIESARAPDGEQKPTFVSVREVPKSKAGEGKEAYTTRLFAALRETEPLSFDTLEEFCNWACTQKLTDFVAHNLRGYDGVLIHAYMRYKLKIKTKPVLAGLKVMTFKFGSNRMIDSLNHLASSLAGLPKTLGIKIEGVEKDHFPHKINTTENRNYSGPLPPLSAYEPDEQSCNIEELKEWHEAESAKYDEDNPWVLKEVEARYCHQDTLVLAMAVGEYRRLCIEMTEIDPIKSTTIASFCMKVFRSKHIPIEGIPTLSKEESAFARRALKGGRTEVFKTYVKAPMGYDDVVSLYPSRQFFETMPYGVPRIFKGDAIPADWLEGVGFAEVDVTPCKTVPGVAPKDFVPLLGGYSDDGKLRFDTTSKKRQVYTLAELSKAVEIGYVIDAVYEVHLYEGRDDIFKSYVSTFLKVKVESSKPPRDADATIEEHRRDFGIELDREKLMAPENKGMRSLAKLALNNLWGKLGQRELPTTELCDQVAYFKLMTRFRKGEIEIESIAVDRDLPNSVSVTYKELTRKDEMVRLKNHVGIAAYVTSTARLKLYERIGDPQLAGKIVYCDTDSCVYIKSDTYSPPQGRALGEWESEGDDFDEFVALAPKVYAIRGPSQSMVKTKGFRMTNRAKQLITFESLKECLDDSDKRITVPYANYFKRTKHAITVVPMDKALGYKPEGSKRRIIPGSRDLAPW